jgi:DNA modification methylase
MRRVGGMPMLTQADALRLPLADDSVDLVVTSPPYFALRSYRDGDEHYDGQIGSEASPQEFLEALWAATAEMVRVVKPSGSIFVNLGDKYSGVNPGSYRKHTHPSPRPHHRYKAVAASETEADHRPEWGGVRQKSLMGLPWRYAIGCIDDLGLILRSEIVWSKPNGLPESVTDRVRRNHEQWFHFTLEPRYFSAIDEIREPHIHAESPGARRGPSGMNRGTATGRTHDDGAPVGNFNHDPLGKLPGSVWSIPSEPLQVPDHLGVDHFAAFPQEWPRRLILGWCPAQVCSECGEGRTPVVELDAEYAAYREATGDWNASLRTADGYDQKANRSVDGTPQSWKGQITGYACACPDTTAPSTPGVVLDPFVGTGTVPMVARALGRTGIGVDLSADYLRLANWRVFESGHAAKTMRRTNQERQGSLL